MAKFYPGQRVKKARGINNPEGQANMRVNQLKALLGDLLQPGKLLHITVARSGEEGLRPVWLEGFFDDELVKVVYTRNMTREQLADPKEPVTVEGWIDPCEWLGVFLAPDTIGLQHRTRDELEARMRDFYKIAQANQQFHRHPLEQLFERIGAQQQDEPGSRQ